MIKCIPLKQESLVSIKLGQSEETEHSEDMCTYKYSSILTDPSLNLSNLTSAVHSLPDLQWDMFGYLMNVPVSTRKKIRSQFHSDGERKTALLRVYLTEHPHPTWEHVSDALYRMMDGQYHGVLERLQSMFPTGESVHGTF